MRKKMRISVNARYRATGLVLPISIEWFDGQCSNIQKIHAITDVVENGYVVAKRYTVDYDGETHYLYFEDTFCRWFVMAEAEPEIA